MSDHRRFRWAALLVVAAIADLDAVAERSDRLVRASGLPDPQPQA